MPAEGLTATVWESLIRLIRACESEGFKGYDPYDGLNSRFFQSLPLIPRSRVARLMWIQFFKRSPINLRKYVGVGKDYNPKAIGLFLTGYCHLYRIRPHPHYLDVINFLIDKLKQLQNRNYSGACWGYNFDWQSRAFFQPRNSPTVVVTSFAGNALLDAYELIGDAKNLKLARSSCDFILNDLNRNYDEDRNFAFSYSPSDNATVFNASLLGSRLLSRVSSITGESALAGAARSSVAFCCAHQQPNGAFTYGTLPYHQWVDSFHTGFILECLSDYSRFTHDEMFKINLEKGYKYYVSNFFTNEGVPKYYNNSIYPIDIHAPAQLIITLCKLGKFEEQRPLLNRVLAWTIANMQSKQGLFYYQINKYFTSKISYMRWSQAWMFCSLSTYLYHHHLICQQLSTEVN